MTATQERASGKRRGRIAEWGAAWLGIVGGVGLTVLRAASGDSYDRAPLPVIAFGVLIAMPGVLALMARRRRPSLYLASALIYLPLSFMSLAGVTLPLLIPAGMALVAYGRHSDEETPLVWGPLVAVTLMVLAIGAFAALLLWGGDDPRCSNDGSSCTSDVVSNGEALLSLTGVGLALAAGWFLSTPRPDRLDR